MSNQIPLNEVLKRYSGHPEFIGIDLHDVNQKGAVDNTVLHLAAGRGEVDDLVTLVANGAEINLPGDLGNTPLHFAALMGKTKAVETLLRLGANPELLNEFQQTPLDVARLDNQRDITSLLETYL